MNNVSIDHKENISRRCIKHLRSHVGLAQLVGIVVCLPPLIFPDQVPVWMIPAAILGLALTFWAGRWLAGRAFVHTPLDLPLLLLLLLMPLNILISADRALTWPHVYKIIGGTAIFYGAVGFLREKPWFDLSALGIALLGLVLGGVLLFGTQWSGAKLSWLPCNLAGRIPRLVNPFWKPEGFAGFNANLAGGTVALLLPVPLGYVLFGSRRWVRIGAMLETVALSTLLLLTFSRGAMLAFGAALLVMLVAYDRRWLALVGAVLVVGAVLLVTGQLDSILDPVRNGSITDSVQGLDSRLELWSRGIYMMQDFAFTGVGMGMVEKVLPLLYPTFLIPPSTDVEHVHNLYLEFGAELGFPGLIIVLAQLLLLFFLGWRSVQQSRGTTWGALASGLLGTVVVLAVHGLVDTIPFSPKAYLIIWALFGVTVALALHLRDDGTSTGNTPLPEPGGDSESLHHP